MIADLQAVLWKELKEIPWGRRSGLLSLLIGVGMIGIVLPLQAGPKFFQLGEPIAVMFFSTMLIIAWIADSFAGERERHTLEALLATPLSDRGILFGKIIAVVIAGWSISALSFVLGLMLAIVKYGAGSLPVSALAMAAVVLLSLIPDLFVASAGVLVSLRARTVRQAQQILSTCILIVLFAGMFGMGSVPREWFVPLSRMAAGVSYMTVILAGAAILLLLDLAILGAAMTRFRRPHLILD